MNETLITKLKEERLIILDSSLDLLYALCLSEDPESPVYVEDNLLHYSPNYNLDKTMMTTPIPLHSTIETIIDFGFESFAISRNLELKCKDEEERSLYVTSTMEDFLDFIATLIPKIDDIEIVGNKIHYHINMDDIKYISKEPILI